MNRFLQTLGEKSNDARGLRPSHVAEVIASRFKAWRYGQRLSSEQLAKDHRLLELARNALTNPLPRDSRLAIAANLGSMARRYAEEIIERGDDSLLEVQDVKHPAPVQNASDGHSPEGTKAIFTAQT